MKRLLYTMTAVIGLLICGQSAQADWVPKYNPVTGLLDYWWDPTVPIPGHPDPEPPYPGNWLVVRTFVGIFAFPLD